MPRLNPAHLAIAAAHLETANAVRRDPAVIKAYKQFKQDGARAVRSGTALAHELKSSWLRHCPPTKGTETGE
ncbi:hypothetical protein [Streptomyces bauhiniae]|uniref:Uncharacterized protein n=1 Tax=Streptomyces bauhiniae TaxID=2340725 RepID=A0A7K3QTC0_9ACTN|nr:hypothetical protein [Streptomyces bauhiniae]NEB93126.1 hypothetical protein [Streptomyces bauhiniae]